MTTRRTIVRVAPVIVHSAAIFAISAMSDPPAPDLGFKLGDKLNHLTAYAVLAVLAVPAIVALQPTWSLRKVLWIAGVYCGLFGASDELHQWFVPQRTAEVGDWIADAIGAAVALALVSATRTWRPTQWLTNTHPLHDKASHSN